MTIKEIIEPKSCPYIRSFNYSDAEINGFKWWEYLTLDDYSVFRSKIYFNEYITTEQYNNEINNIIHQIKNLIRIKQIKDILI